MARKKEGKKTAPEPTPEQEAPKVGTRYGAGPLKDPLPEQSFYHAKNLAWQEYNNQYYPLLRGFQDDVRDSAVRLSGAKAKEGKKSIAKMQHSKNAYIKRVMVYFEGYLNTYCIAYIHEQLRQNRIDPKQIPVILAQARQEEGKAKKGLIGPKKVGK